MSRYIDADKLKPDYYEEYEVEDDEYVCRYYSEEQIDKAPSIDIVPKHGERQYICSGKWMFRRCSCCEWTQTYDDSKYMGYRYNFCPNCGAKMDGERKDI